MRNAKLLLLNTTVLTIGGFMMRTISVSFNVYLTNKIGVAGIGLFQLIMAVYALAVTFAGAGVKLGATRLVTDSASANNDSYIMSTCLHFATVAGCIMSVLLFIFSEIISVYWINDTRAVSAIKILALSLPPISISAAINGYFTAKKTMVKYSLVQLTEQLIKIIITIIALNNCKDITNAELSTKALCIGITSSEISSAVISFFLFKIETKSKHIYNKADYLKPLLHIAVPDVIGSGFRSILLTVEHLLIPKGFTKSGQSTEKSMAIYGTIHGMSLPVILYPSAILTSLSSLLIPEISRYKSLKNEQRISLISSVTLKLTFVFSIGVSSYMLFFADYLSVSIYSDNEPAFYIKLLSILIPIMYTDMITDGLLKGLDQQAASMRYNIFDSGLCVILVYVLLPNYAVKGYIFILFISEIINFSLSFNRLCKYTYIRINILNDLIKPIICALISCAVSNIFISTVGINTKVSLTIATVISLLNFMFLIRFSDCITKSEIKFYSSMFKKVTLD